MAKLPAGEIERIVERDMPGHRVSTKSSSIPVRDQATRDSRDSFSSPSVTNQTRTDELRSKYLGDADWEEETESSDTDHEIASDAASGNDDDTEIIAVEPEQAAHPWDRGARPKAAVISAKEKKIIGQQG